MKAYKGTNKHMQCQDYQFEMNKEHIHEGAVEPCTSGFHACTNPMDVLHYYSPAAESRYFEVDCDGEIKYHNADSKIACSKIIFNTEINLFSLINTGVSMIFDRIKTMKSDQYSSGDQSTAATSGYQSTAATSGYQSTAATSGDQSAAAASGDRSVAVANGNKAKAKGALGNYLVLTEYNLTNELIDCQCKKVDGKEIKPDTFYILKSGKFEEWEE